MRPNYFSQQIYRLISELGAETEEVKSRDSSNRIWAIYEDTLDGDHKIVNDKIHDFFDRVLRLNNTFLTKGTVDIPLIYGSMARYFSLTKILHDCLTRYFRAMDLGRTEEEQSNNLNKVRKDFSTSCVEIKKIILDVAVSIMSPEYPGMDQETRRILKDRDEIFSDLSNLKEQFVGFIDNLRTWNRYFWDVRKSESLLETIRHDIKFFKDSAGQTRGDLLMNLQIYVDLGMPHELPSLKKTFYRHPNEDIRRINKEIMFLHKLFPDNDFLTFSSRSTLSKLINMHGEKFLNLVNCTARLRSYTDQIKLNYAQILENYDAFEWFYMDYSYVLKVPGECGSCDSGSLYSTQTRHQRLREWSLIERRLNFIRVKDHIKEIEMEKTTKLNSLMDAILGKNRAISKFASLRADLVSRQLEIHGYSVSMFELQEKIKRLGEESLSLLEAPTEMQSIPPEKLFLDTIRKKVDHLKIQIEKLLELISFNEYPRIKSSAEKWIKDEKLLHKELNGIRKKLKGIQNKITPLNLDDVWDRLNTMNQDLRKVYNDLKPKTGKNKVIKRSTIIHDLLDSDTQKDINDQLIKVRDVIYDTHRSITEIDRRINEYKLSYREHADYLTSLDNIKSNYDQGVTNLLQSTPHLNRLELLQSQVFLNISEAEKNARDFLEHGGRLIISSPVLNSLQELHSVTTPSHPLLGDGLIFTLGQRSKPIAEIKPLIPPADIEVATRLFESLFEALIEFADEKWIDDNKKFLQKICFSIHWCSLAPVQGEGDYRSVLKCIDENTNLLYRRLKHGRLSSSEGYAFVLVAEKFKKDLVVLLEMIIQGLVKKPHSLANMSRKRAVVSIINALNENERYKLDKSLLASHSFAASLFQEPDPLRDVDRLLNLYNHDFLHCLQQESREEEESEEKRCDIAKNSIE